MISLVTKSDLAVVTISKYSGDYLPLPDFGAKIRGKIKRGGSAALWVSSIFTVVVIRDHFVMCHFALIEPQ
jgi:hypothetical protein